MWGTVNPLHFSSSFSSALLSSSSSLSILLRCRYLSTIPSRSYLHPSRCSPPPSSLFAVSSTTTFLFAPVQTQISARMLASPAPSVNSIYVAETRDFEGAIKTLNSLQSNLNVLAAWEADRRAHTSPDWVKIMNQYLDALHINAKELSVVHVTGTKGKGSTCAFVESILREAGHKTGLFTSPHLKDVRERFRINGEMVSKELFSRYFWELWDGLMAIRSDSLPIPAFFRFLTLLALKMFECEKIEAAVMEVGIGGRTDATNVFSTSGCVVGIGSIGHDHMNVLGNTIRDIAREKAGIMYTTVPAFTVSQQYSDASEVLHSYASTNTVPLKKCPDLELYTKESLRLGLQGEHQKMNASLAVALSNVWMATSKNSKSSLKKQVEGIYDRQINNYDDVFLKIGITEEIRQGLVRCHWPGRAQSFVSKNVLFYLDGAHTSESMQACSNWFYDIQQQDTDKSNTLDILLFHCGAGRDPKKLLFPLTSPSPSSSPSVSSSSSEKKGCLFDKAIFTTFNVSPQPATLVRANKADDAPEWQLYVKKCVEELYPLKQQDSEVFSCVSDGINRIYQLAENTPDKKIRVLVTGSLYLVGAVLQVCNVPV
eukprot:TRINITY_DN3373_c0_g1_i1.p1 TRINITY_DN3373_c0_g1~~TRINITY_DN3373_c0_g1_i1.p1  ORF type:complete len:598 (+),score=143.12 TRINITY_DN3373_c0_g1_i1:65-1858(+)